MIYTSEIQKVRDSFQSILRADYISINDMKQLKELDGYYVDFFKNLPKVLQNQDSYICGRRGTGKTTLLMRAYYECLKTISPKVKEQSMILNYKKVLPLYIDLSKCKDIFGKDSEDSLERNFILKLIKEFENQLNTIFQQPKLKIFGSNKIQQEAFEKITKLIQEGAIIKAGKFNTVQEKVADSSKSAGAILSLKEMAITAEMEDNVTIKTVSNLDEVSSCNVQNFLEYLGEIRITCGLDAIYVFVDEFSDLSEEDQEKFSKLLKKLLGSKNNIYFKVGTITDRYYFGENIIIGRDIYPISLDLCDFVERYGGIVSASKELVRYTEELVVKRLEIFAKSVPLEDIFRGDIKVIMARISKEAVGVPRTIGLILQNALTQAETRNEVNIQLSDIRVGIRETRKMFFKQFQGAVQKRIIPAFYMDMWNSLLKRALEEKNKNNGRPASHFMINPSRKKYLNVFCENFIVHYLEDNRASKYGGNYVLYALDYDICNENNILYADERDQFTAGRFVYDSVFQEYDCFFMKDKIKSYRCPNCSIIYDEADVARMKIKRCFECDEKLVEIIHQEVAEANDRYTEVEVKILGLIATLERDEAMTAVEIGYIVGCSHQKVATWCSRVLRKEGLIEIEKKGGRNYYYDKTRDVE